jgi:hypothetical protein
MSQSDNEKPLKEALDYLDQGMEEALNMPRSNETELIRTFREVARNCGRYARLASRVHVLFRYVRRLE